MYCKLQISVEIKKAIVAYVCAIICVQSLAIDVILLYTLYIKYAFYYIIK